MRVHLCDVLCPCVPVERTLSRIRCGLCLCTLYCVRVTLRHFNNYSTYVLDSVSCFGFRFRIKYICYNPCVFSALAGRAHTAHTLLSPRLTSSTPPPPPTPPTHTVLLAAVVGNKLVVFGGNNGERSFNDVHVLECAAPPSSATASTSTSSRGAAGSSPASCSTSTSVSEISLAGVDPDALQWSWTQPLCVGAPPCARTGATATTIGDRWVLICGGWDPDNTAGKRVASSRANSEQSHPSRYKFKAESH